MVVDPTCQPNVTKTIVCAATNQVRVGLDCTRSISVSGFDMGN
jgi:hypothetical protein